MTCTQWQEILAGIALDDLERDLRHRFLAHLHDCEACRRATADEDPTLLFALAPAVEVSGDEVEEIRRTVQAMRRVRALEDRWSPRVRRGLGAAAFAALLLMALFVNPERPGREVVREVPFAGALGVGSGLVQIGDPAGTGLENPPLDVIANPRPSTARIYQQTGDDLIVVVIVDESFDLDD